MKEIKRLLYSSLVDVSVPYGPGVNERGFIKDMARRFGDNFKAVIPRPSRGLPKEFKYTNISYLNYTMSSRNVFGWIEARLVGSLRLRSIMNKFQPEFIVMRLGALSLPHYFTIKQSTIPYAVKTGGTGNYEAFYKKNPLRRITKGSNEYITRKILNHCVAIDVVNDMQRTSLIESFPQIADRVVVVDNGVDLQIFSEGNGSSIREKYGISTDDIVIGYVGGFPMHRGGKEVIDLVKCLDGSLSVRGIIVGDSGDADQCKQYAFQEGVSNLITITGQVDFEEVPDLMSAMDIGLSILRPWEQHASEQKVRQYLAAGQCVIGTKGSNDFLRGHDFARIVSADDIPEITDAALSLLAEGRAGLKRRAAQAKLYAQTKHSIESRNNDRLELWSASIASKKTLERKK